MAAVTVTATMAAGVVYTIRTDTSADFPSVANNKYIYNLADKLVYYKDANGLVQPTFITSETTAVGAAIIAGGGGTTLTDTDTFDGYTLAQVVKALRNLNILQ